MKFSSLISHPSAFSAKLSALVALFLLLCCGTAFAVDITRTAAYQFITINYLSVDNENKPVMLSEGIFIPTTENYSATPETVQFVVVSSHGTVFTNREAPTGDSPLDGSSAFPHGAMGFMTSENALVICPDYLGYGASSSYVHPYCNHTLTAKNVLDGYVAAIDTVNARGVKFADDYYTLLVGYSQGGAATMAVHKYIETEASQDVVDLVRLKHSYCGAGPYDLPLTYKDLAARDSLAYSCSIPMTIEGLKVAYNEGCMKQVDLDSVYTSKELRVYAEKLLAAKIYDNVAINDFIAKFLSKTKVNAADLIRPEVLSNTSYAAHAINKALGKCNLLDGTWTPKAPITMFQYTGDDVVPYANSEEAVQVLGDKLVFYNEKSGLECTNPWMKLMLAMTMSNPKNHLDYGTVFYFYFLDGVLREK